MLKNLNLKFDSNGLITAIVQDVTTKQILMVAFQNLKAVEKTFAEKAMYFYSRSRKKLWKKGETSGHIQKVVETRIDCDNDAILYLVNSQGACCHKGYNSCFFRKVNESGELEIIEKKVFNPEEVYK